MTMRQNNQYDLLYRGVFFIEVSYIEESKSPITVGKRVDEINLIEICFLFIILDDLVSRQFNLGL